MNSRSRGVLSAGDFLRVLRCLGLVIAMAVGGVLLLFWFAGGIEREWEDARPTGLTKEAWRAQRDQCEYASLNAAECGKTPIKRIDALAAEVRRKERLELCAEDARYDAIEEAKKVISRQLKAPRSAKWSNMRASKVGCDWIVTGEVDSQNSFGAMMRSDVRVKLARASQQTWVPVSVEMS